MWNGWKAQLLRTLYYETEPVLTGGFSEVNRAQRVAMAQAEFRAAFISIFKATSGKNADGTTGEPKYSIRAAFPPTADLTALKSQAQAAADLLAALDFIVERNYPARGEVVNLPAWAAE